VDKEPMVEANQALLNLSENYYHTFKEGPGKKVIDDLNNIIELSCLSPNGAMDFQAEISPEQLMFMREGQNQVIRYIKQMIKYFKENRNG
jgi:hypothetical protein